MPRWAVVVRACRLLRPDVPLQPSVGAAGPAFWRWRVTVRIALRMRAFRVSLARVVLGRWAAAARLAWFTAAQAGTLYRLRVEVGVRSLSWPP